MDLLPSESFILINDQFGYINLRECTGQKCYSAATKCACQASTHGLKITTNQLVTVETTDMFQTTTANPNALTDLDPPSVPEKVQVWIYLLACVVGVFSVIIAILGASICIHIVRKKTQSKCL